MNQSVQPFGKFFTVLTKQYINLLSKQLEHIPIDRYFYPLYLISQSNDTYSQNDLAEQLFVDKVTVVRIIDYLEKHKMAERLEHPQDRRCHVLNVTEKGWEFIPTIEKAMIKTNEVFLNLLNEPLKSLFEEEIGNLAYKVAQFPDQRFDILFNKIS